MLEALKGSQSGKWWDWQKASGRDVPDGAGEVSGELAHRQFMLFSLHCHIWCLKSLWEVNIWRGSIGWGAGENGNIRSPHCSYPSNSGLVISYINRDQPSLGQKEVVWRVQVRNFALLESTMARASKRFPLFLFPDLEMKETCCWELWGKD